MKSLPPDLLNAEAILDSIDDSVVMMGPDKKVRYLNRAAERLLGYTREEASEQPCSMIVRCTACENDCLLEKTISTGQPIRQYETVLFNKNGRMILVSSNMVLLKDQNGQILGGVEIIRDRSQIEALAEQLERKYSEVREEFVQHAIQQEDPLRVVEKQLILKVLSQTGWNYKEAAERLKVSRTTLWRKIKSLGIDRPKSKPSSVL